VNVEKVEDHMDFFLDNLSRRESVDLFLIVIGERPACLIMDPNETEKERLKDFCDDFDLHWREKQSKQDSTLSSSGFFISRDKRRFKHLKDSGGRFYGFSDVDVGRFLGFPEEDVEFFAENIEDGPLEVKTRKVVEDLVTRGKIPSEDARLVELASYVPKPDEENVIRALEKGRRYRNALLEFDESYNSSIGRKVLEEFFGQVLN
jgi:hypothetical protein